MSASALELSDTPRALDPDRLSGYIDPLYRAAWALCGSRHDAENLVQDTFAQVLQRPRWMRNHHETDYPMGPFRNTRASRYRAASARAATCELFEDDAV